MSLPQFQKAEDGRWLLSGELSMTTVPVLVKQDFLQKRGGKIRVDLQDVQRADSAGVALLIEWRRLAQHHQCSIHFQNVPSQMLAIARLSGVDDLLSLT